jgi:hypothetical protein
MAPLTNIANLNSLDDSLLRASAKRSNPKPHRIKGALPWDAPTTPGVAQIAKLPQLLVRRSLALMPRSRAPPAPSASQWEPLRMQPVPALQLLYRHKKRTRHGASSVSGFYRSKNKRYTKTNQGLVPRGFNQPALRDVHSRGTMGQANLENGPSIAGQSPKFVGKTITGKSRIRFYRPASAGEFRPSSFCTRDRGAGCRSFCRVRTRDSLRRRVRRCA